MKKEYTIIDFERKGNLIRFYLGENGKQYGDDWDDAPYEHNCGPVYDEFIKEIVDVYVPFDIDISEPADNYLNSPLSREDFIERKTYALEFFKDFESIGTIYFGDKIKNVHKILEI